MRILSMRLWIFCTAARMGTRRRSLLPADRQRGNFAMKRRRATSESISAWPLPWRISLSADGKTVSSAFCTGRGATPWSFIRSPKWLSSAGRARKRENSSAGARVNTKPLHLDVNEQIECAQTLASKFYTDPAVLEIEKTRIFLRTWQLVGTLSHACGEVNGVQRTIA